MAILVTGGAGYIGSHTSVQLLNAGYDIVVIDNLSNSKFSTLQRVREITDRDFTFYQADLLDRETLRNIFSSHRIEAVIHFAGLKSVGESARIPLHYYHNNITGTLNLCEVMQKHGVKKLVFSSSATVYGVPEQVPITEEAALGATNPYGRTKLMLEQILYDLWLSDTEWSIALLRYFNPIGAHPSGKIGEDPRGIPNNLVPYVSQVAAGKLKELSIFGGDYCTPDGTGIRDYIHVMDLADGHLKALDKVLTEAGIEAFNLGTGKGYSVLEVVDAFRKATGKTIPVTYTTRRPGDVDVSIAAPDKAREKLGWVAKRDIGVMCEDAWRWQANNLTD
ncbi:UDP-galactose-4-epimerase [Gordoniibacillus kamchatkensis]|uniref:UDP-glucose 4-epimerase n=1 Tax=Gordoniibacillus kamchatkensis TaxID=1590651 RepID=A0ABR5AGF4_9BACL|nr:UDP-glucose 4-epimerase GalE [Paenibacillus sp. VKM B-2647]KIL40121.1 UDP-galactose-4-epimerase [Paenibacillus sp. VKM B-2647]